MTRKDFNKKYKDFIEPGFEGLEFDNLELVSLLDTLFEDLTKIPGFTYSQIKIKFGYPRFYSTGISNLLNSLIEQFIHKYI